MYFHPQHVIIFARASLEGSERKIKEQPPAPSGMRHLASQPEKKYVQKLRKLGTTRVQLKFN